MMIRKRKAGSPVKRLLKGALVDIRASDAVVNSSGNVTHLLNSANRNQSAYFDGVDDYISTPDSGALALTGAVQTWTFYGVASADITPAQPAYLGCQYDTGSSQRSWVIGIDTLPLSHVVMFMSNDGLLPTEINSSVPLPYADDELFDLQVVRTASTGNIDICTTVSGGTFSQLGATVTGGDTGALFNTSANLRIGCIDLSGVPNQFFNGTIQRFTLYDDSRLAASWDARDQTDYAATTLESVGPELVTNGGFDDDSAWTKSAGATIADGALTLNSGSDVYALENILSLGDTYEVTLDYNITSGAAGLYAGMNGGVGGSVVSLAALSGEGTITGRFTVTSDTRFSIRDASGCVATFDNVSVKQISTYTSVGGAAYRDPYDLDVVSGTLKYHPANSLLLDGVSGSYASAPDSPAASITGDITLVGYHDVDIFPPVTTNAALASKFVETGNQRSYRAEIAITTGYLQFLTSVDGTAVVTSASDAAPVPTTGFHWKVSHDVSANTANYYVSYQDKNIASSSVTWVQLGSADIAHTSGGIYDSTAIVEIGSYATGTLGTKSGTVSRASIISGLDSTATPAVDFNPANQGQLSGTDSATFFGAEMLTPSSRTINATDWTESGTGSITDNGDGTVTVDDQDVDSNEYRVDIPQPTIAAIADTYRMSIVLSPGTASKTDLWLRCVGTSADQTQCRITWSDPLNPTFATAIDNGDGSYTYTLEVTNTGLNVLLDLKVFPASVLSSATGSVIVHGEVSLQSEWTLHGNTRITDVDTIQSWGGAYIETLVAPALVATPMTMFLSGKVDELTGAIQRFTGGRTTATAEPALFVNAANNFVFDAGSGINGGAADTDPHLLTARHNGDTTSSLQVSGASVVVGDSGTESYDYGTLFANTAGGQDISGSISRYVLLDKALTDSQAALLSNHLAP